MAFQPAAVEAGHDPRAHTADPDIKVPDHPVLPDGTRPNLESYLYYAQRRREREVAEPKSHDAERAKILFGNLAEKHSVVAINGEKKGDSISDAEYRAASSALRTASWGSVFYLITTGPWSSFLEPFSILFGSDILGPYSAPWAFSQVGYGPGVACFIAFAIMAAYSGLLLSYMFLKLDSDEYPLRTFGDLGYRIYGPWFRHRKCQVSLLKTEMQTHISVQRLARVAAPLQCWDHYPRKWSRSFANGQVQGATKPDYPRRSPIPYIALL